MLDSAPKLIEVTSDFPAIKRSQLETLQVNLGYLCNLSCTHCHVNAGPTRKEQMDNNTISLVLEYLQQKQIKTLDLTGGAPELNPHFRYLVLEARELGVEVIDRCNLTILNEPGQESLAEFLAEQQVHVVASLPCYSQVNVDKQRGKGVFERSIEGLHALNQVGYGLADSGLILDLVYNPGGPFLPPPQKALEDDYHARLKEDFGIVFNNLFTLTNMPISRFGAVLLSKGEFDSYMNLLKDNFSEQNLNSLMCRNTLSIDWQGYTYDCDFNQMLHLPLGGKRTHLKSLLSQDLDGRKIAVADHCYGCTAGQGSSCGGALAEGE